MPTSEEDSCTYAIWAYAIEVKIPKMEALGIK
jgi:hypothetical protein